jgi:hypothetical protein
MPPKKQMKGGDWKDIARNVAKAGLAATTAFAPEIGVPLDIGATLLGLGRRLKSMEDKLESQKYGNESGFASDPSSVRSRKRITSEQVPDAAQYENNAANYVLDGGKYQIAGTNIVAGSDLMAGKYQIGGSEKVAGSKGRSPLYDTLRKIKK